MEPAKQETGAVSTVFSPDQSTISTAESIAMPAETPLDLPAPETGSPAETPQSFASCSDNLTFMGDLTFPDRARVLPGQPLEKRWKVRNSGLCDWGPEYRFRWVGGAELSTRQEFALFPAAAGSEVVLSVLLTAPLAPGEYVSNWRAFSPLGIAFGDTLYIDVVVSS